MKTKITEDGLLIPRFLFEGVEEVEIRKEKNVIVIVPVEAPDPILELGKQPIEAPGIEDASTNSDRYLYPA
jgi:virulence-associated protein VagC